MSRGDWIQTFTGKKFYPLAPLPEDIDPRDVAHALGNLCRFGGHTHEFYSVAEHSYHLSMGVSDSDAAWALLHDAAEAYLVDVPRPVKRMLTEYKAIEFDILQCIATRFDLEASLDSPIYPLTVKDADNRILLTERLALMPNTVHRWEEVEDQVPFPANIVGWTPMEARDRFMTRLSELALL